MKLKNKIWLGITAIAVVVGVEKLWPSDWYVHDLLCRSSEEDCFRQWLSALGGWAALVIGAPTLYILWKQISDADENQKIAFRIQLRRTRALALRVIKQANELEGETMACIAQWDRSGPAHTPRLHPIEAYRDGLRLFLDKLEQAEFRRLEEEVDVSSTITFRWLLKTLQQNLEVIDGRAFKEFDLDEYKTAAGEMLFTGRRVLEYSKEIRRIAEEHLLEIKDIFPH
ncbi:hypothetical protein [Rhizobium rhizogenes]|uniref:hypothetical protein n=1 Tax=Rhizobium rhizogenes TaxID=359 RepID=UPI0015730C3F|nr:hypothetical protein [Rhizobium rhizogenes]NTG41671.1 hypothetical protein [Rhizobium rhizogenes]